ncbi:MAG: hypothetical protein GF344_13430 [Chitinivibrionales bacterium]|nr:hypothetical protein [Chitinivibrionales bacterium]MBD3357732.1 hypothetical protein [Chitinivibrionales bacterium]
MIDSLVYLRYSGVFLDERVTFSGMRGTTNAVADKAVIHRFAPSDSVRYHRTVFTAGGDLLERLEHVRIFTGTNKNIDSLSFGFDNLSRGSDGALGRASFEAVLHLPDGSAGLFSGTIGARGEQHSGKVGETGELTGVYRLGNERYRVRAQEPGSVTIESTDE